MTTTAPTTADVLMSEASLEAGVKKLAKLYGWLYYHTWKSIHSPAGFPDCVLARGGRVIFAELKRQKADPTAEQTAWLQELGKCPGYEVFVWRPSDLEEIRRILA